ncbi:MAG: serine/threonine-protein kinase [Legionellaceae bacterium]|nr:serine/threonine-protein kinase [Legionellaceae bacterium]
MSINKAMKSWALKRISKEIEYINNSEPQSAEHQAKVDALNKISQQIHLELFTNYAKVISDYHQKFSEKDWDAVERYFQENPDKKYAGSKEGFMYSYLQVAPGIIRRREEECGKGIFGRARFSQARVPEGGAIIKRQKIVQVDAFRHRSEQQKKRLSDSHYQLLNDRIKIRQSNGEDISDLQQKIECMENWYKKRNYDAILIEYELLPLLQKEAEINLDVGVATSELLIRRDTDGVVYKVYQDMPYLGESLDKVLQKLPPDAQREREDYAIDLLLYLEKLHIGECSRAHKSICHGDIKVENIVLHAGELRFIDFGMASNSGLDQAHTPHQGSMANIPVSYSIPLNNKERVTYLQEYKLKINNHQIEKTPSYFFDDKVAALRTIFHSFNAKNTIYTQEMWNQLPPVMQALLDTSNVARCITHNKERTLQFISAALILYKEDQLACTEERLSALAKDVQAQHALICAYTALKSASKQISASPENSSSAGMTPYTPVSSSVPGMSTLPDSSLLSSPIRR